MRLMKKATERGGSHQAPVFERTPVLCLGTESVARLAAEPYGPLIPLMKHWNWWGRADRHIPFGQVLSFFLLLYCLTLSDLWIFVFVCLRMREKREKEMGEGNRDKPCVSAPVCVCVFWVSSHLMNCLATTEGCELPSRWDPVVVVVMVNNALPRHHNSQSSSQRLADPNGNVIFQIKDGQALMRGGVMGSV